MSRMDQNIAQAEKIIGYSFANKLNAAEALQMGDTWNNLPINGELHKVKRNNLLKIYGQTTLEAVLSKMLLKMAKEGGKPQLSLIIRNYSLRQSQIRR
jgi:hypothetical protein